MPEVTRRTLLSFTAAASVVEPRLVKGKLPDANCRRKRRFGWFENAAGCRGSGLRKAPTEGAGKVQVNSTTIEIFQLKQPLVGKYGGESGIRTRVTVSRKHTFQACAFNHSATSPSWHFRCGRFRRAGWGDAVSLGDSGPELRTVGAVNQRTPFPHT